MKPYAEVVDVQGLRRQAVRFVAAERQCYREGTSESTNLDGLAATTHIATERRYDDDMEVDEDGMNAMGKFDGNCRKCGTYGHKAANCRKGDGKMTRNPGGERKCYRCDRTNHLKKDCRAKTKANGDKIVDKIDKNKKEGGKKFEKKKWGKVRKQAEVTDDEEEHDEEDFQLINYKVITPRKFM